MAKPESDSDDSPVKKAPPKRARAAAAKKAPVIDIDSDEDDFGFDDEDDSPVKKAPAKKASSQRPTQGIYSLLAFQQVRGAH